MRQRFFEIGKKKIKVYDAETTYKEIVFESIINFLYAYVANVTTPFIVRKYDWGVFFGFLFYFYFLSYIINRDKYNTKFGRYVLMPLPCVLGAFVAYKTGFLIVEFFTK